MNGANGLVGGGAAGIAQPASTPPALGGASQKAGKRPALYADERIGLEEALRRQAGKQDQFVMLSATEKKLGMKFNGVEVTTVVPAGWAERQGVEIDDEIHEVQGESFAKMSREQKLVALQGPRPVAINIKRPAIKDFYYSLTLAETKLGMGFKGARVSSVAAGGWADRSGIHPGDEIVEVGGVAFASLQDDQKINCFKQPRPFELRFKRPAVVSKRIAAAGVSATADGANPTYLQYGGGRVPGMPSADMARKSMHYDEVQAAQMAAAAAAATGSSPASLANSAVAAPALRVSVPTASGGFSPQGASGFGVNVSQPSTHGAPNPMAMSQQAFQFSAPPPQQRPQEQESLVITVLRELLACCSSSGAAAATTTQHDISYR